ncbi:MAG: type II secretion system protein [Rhodocyclaceae bacterium]|nr:type II secretion system protein [Rhodocyclaceae bacterium]
MRKVSGFTLVEAIVVIVIMGILSAMVAVFIRAPVEAYLDTARRGILANAADIALRRMGRDLRLAVPNSIRPTGACAAANCYLEFLPIKDGGRYRWALTAASGGDILDPTNPADGSFDVLGPAVTGVAGDFLVVNNATSTGTTGCDNAYDGCNRRTLSAPAGASVSFTVTAGAMPASPHYSFQIVPASGAVTYACEGVGINAAGTGTGTLRRYTNYGIPSAQPTPPAGAGVTSALLADGLSACSLAYDGYTGLVLIQLTLSQENEAVTLYHEVHVDNVY